MKSNKSLPVFDRVIDTKDFNRTDSALIDRGSKFDKYAFAKHKNLFSRIAYRVNERNNSIFVCDLLLEIEKEIVPEDPKSISSFISYIPFCLNSGFAIYGISTNKDIDQGQLDSVKASFVSIDFYTGKYELIGTPCEFDATSYRYISCPELLYVASNIIMFYGRVHQSDKARLGIFKLNDSLSFIVSQKWINIPTEEYKSFNLIDGKIVCVRFDASFNSHFYDKIRVRGFAYWNNDTSLFVDIKNTSEHLAAHFRFEKDNIMNSFKTVQSCWHESKFFALIMMQKGLSNRKLPDIALPFLWAFEMNTKIWSKILINVLPNMSIYCFDVDSNGVLFLNGHGVIHKNGDVNGDVKFYYMSTKIHLKKPESLLNNCWSCACKYGISNKCPDLINVLKILP